MNDLIFSGADIFISHLPTVLISGSLFAVITLIYLQYLPHFSPTIRKLLYMMALLKLAIPAFIGIPVIPAREEMLQLTGQAYAAGHRSFGWQEWLFLVWITGFVSILAFVAIRYFMLRRSVGRLVPSGQKGIYIGEKGPLVLGIIRPKIVVPAPFFALDDFQRQTIIEHERAHIENGDHLVGIFAHLLVAATWFNPLSYILLGRIRQQAEMAADDRAVKRTGRDRKDYAVELLGMSERLSLASVSSFTAFSRTHGNLKERITYQLKKGDNMKSRTILAAMTLLLVFLALSLYAEEKEMTVKVKKTDDNTMEVKVGSGDNVEVFTVDIDDENSHSYTYTIDDKGKTVKMDDSKAEIIVVKDGTVKLYTDKSDGEDINIEEIIAASVDEGLEEVIKNIKVLVDGSEDMDGKSMKRVTVNAKGGKTNAIFIDENGKQSKIDIDSEDIRENIKISEDGDEITIWVDDEGFEGKEIEKVVTKKIEIIMDEDGNIMKKTIESD